MRLMKTLSTYVGLVTLLAGLTIFPFPWSAAAGSDDIQEVIVQGSDRLTAAARVRDVGGEITHQLGIIDAVGAELTARAPPSRSSTAYASTTTGLCARRTRTARATMSKTAAANARQASGAGPRSPPTIRPR